MQKVDNSKKIQIGKNEVGLFMVGIDSADIIPYVFQHYFSVGIDHIFYIDNDSSDESLSVLEKYDNVHVWRQKEKFSGYGTKARSGAAWLQILMNQYGIDRWCLISDTDEQFIYPGWENRSIHNFIDSDLCEYDSVHCRFIDMYSNKKVKDTVISGSLIETCPYYDTELYGCRKRVMNFKPCAYKMPLVFYKKGLHINAGFHKIVHCKNIYHGGAVLHFKFTSRLTSVLEKHGHKMSDAKKKMLVYKGVGEVNLYDETVSKFFSHDSFDYLILN